MTDGEFNSLRSMGANGPTNVLQIKADCRATVSWLGYKTMLDMVTLKGPTAIGLRIL